MMLTPYDVFTHFDQLSEDSKKRIKECKFNENKLLDRCELQNGRGNCESDVNFKRIKKCPNSHVRINDMICTIRCPKGFFENVNSCTFSSGIEPVGFYSKQNCISEGYNCVAYFTQVLGCHKNYDFLDGKCYGKCPVGWEEGEEQN